MKLVELGPVTDEQFDTLIDSGDYEREPELIDGYVEWRDAEVQQEIMPHGSPQSSVGSLLIATSMPIPN